MTKLLALAAAGLAAFGAAGAHAETLKLSLADALERARTNSPRLAQLDALQDAAAAGRAAAGANERPWVDLSASYMRQSDTPEFAAPLPGLGTTVLYPNLPDVLRSRAAVNAPLYTGGRTPQLVAAADHELAAARKDREAGRADLALETTAAYWSLVTAREGARVLTEAIASYDAHLVDARHRQEAGLAAANEVLAVQVERDRAELDRIVADHGAQLAEANLARLLGLASGISIEPTDGLSSVPPPPAPLDELVQRALDARPERAALAARAQAADARAQAALSGARPQVLLSAGYDFADPNRRFFPLADSWRTSWDAGVFASWTVLDAGRSRAAAAQARAQAAADRAALVDLEQHIRLEVKQRYLDLSTAAAAVATMEQSVGSARENRRVSEERYRAGVSPSSELLDAETALLRAQLAVTEAEAQRHIADAGLARAVGK